MKHPWLALLLVPLLLCALLPAAALADTSAPSAQDIWRETQLLLPIPAEAQELAYATEDGALAQVSFAFDAVPFVLRMQKTSAFQDVSGGAMGLDVAEADEEYADYQCVVLRGENESTAWWYDAERSASGALRCLSGDGDFDRVLYDVFAGLRRGSSYAGCATYTEGAFSLEYPLVQVEDEALTDKLNGALRQSVQAIAAAHAPDTRVDTAYLSADITGKVFTAEWTALLVAPDAAYEAYSVFTVHVNCETGELAPLRSLLDTDALAEVTYPRLVQMMAPQDWGDDAVDVAQEEYLQALTLDEWKDLLRRADFPTEEGWPPVFASWRDGGYFRDGNEDEFPSLLLYVVVPHALQDQISLGIPFAELDMNLMEQLHIR